jgi:CHAT domain-containing protein
LATGAPAKRAGLLAVPVDIELFDDTAAPCLTVTNLDTGGIAEYLDTDGQVVFRAASWMGRDSRYLLRPPRAEEVAIQIVSLRGVPLDPADFLIQSCEASWTPALVDSLTMAQHLRLARYLGDSVSVDSIEAELLSAIDQLDSSSTDAAVPLTWRAVVHYETAAFYRGQNRLSKAREHYHQARATFAAAGDQAGMAASINALGLVAWREGSADEAWTLFEAALDLRQRLGDRFDSASIWNNMGLLLTQRGDWDEAMESYELALEAFQGPVDLRQPVDPVEVARQAERNPDTLFLPSALNTLNNLALLQRDRGLTDLAERYWRNYLALEAHVPRPTAGAEARSNLGRLLLRLGRLDEALVLLVDAQAPFEAADVPMWRATTAVALSHLYSMLGDIDGAMQYAELAVSAAGEDASVAADARLALGLLHRHNGDYEQALQQFALSADGFGQSDAVPRQRLALMEKAWTRFLDDQIDVALDEHRRLQRELLDAGVERVAAIVQSRLAEILWTRGRQQEAEELLYRALPMHEASGDLYSEIETLERLGRIQAGQPDAIETNRRAIERIEAIRSQDLPPLRQAEFFARRKAVYDRQVQAFLDRGDIERAWMVAESARMQGLRELRRVRRRSRDEPERQNLLDERGRLVARRAAQQAGGAGPSVSDSIRTDQALTLTRELDRVESRLRELDPDRSAESSPSSLQSVQDALSPGQLLVSFYLGDDRSAAWVIRPDGARVVRLPAAHTLASDVSSLLESLRHPRQAMGRIARLSEALRQVLVEPYRRELSDARELLIQADGALHSLTFAVLLAVEGTDPLPLSRVLSAVMGSPDTDVDRTGRSLLLVADPAWSGEPSAPSPFPDQSLLARLIRDRGIGELPGTRREAEAIAALVGESSQVQMNLGARASREYIVRGGLVGHDLIHLATHGLVDLEYPSLSALLLAGEDSLGPAFLRPHDIAELEFDAELVVLSGCETGQGRLLAGSGALSLARPFHIAGARRVLASLWKVDDHRTALLMEHFYRHLLIDQVPAPEALARAQAALRSDPATAHPYYWAGFVLSVNPGS